MVEKDGEWWRVLENGGGYGKIVEGMENSGRSGEQWKEWRTVEEVENGGLVNSGGSGE